MGQSQFVSLLNSQAHSAQQPHAWPDMLPESLSRPVSPLLQVTLHMTVLAVVCWKAHRDPFMDYGIMGV